MTRRALHLALCTLALGLCVNTPQSKADRQVWYTVCGLLFTPDLSTVLSGSESCAAAVYWLCLWLYVVVFYRNCLWLADSFISTLSAGHIGFPHCVHVCFPLRFLERTSRFLVTYSDKFWILSVLSVSTLISRAKKNSACDLKLILFTQGFKCTSSLWAVLHLQTLCGNF